MCNIRAAGAILIAATLLGCDGRIYELEAVERQPLTTTNPTTDSLLRIVERIALANGFHHVELSDNQPDVVASYRAEVSPYKDAHGSVSIGVRRTPTGFVVGMFTFPAFDYVEAKTFREQLKARLQLDLPETEVQGS